MEPSRPTYADAIRLLNSTQTGYKVLSARIKAGTSNLDADSVPQMRRWLRCIGYAPADLDRLNVVHVAGTKGKGTTCAFTNAILEQYRLRAQSDEEEKGRSGGGSSSSSGSTAASATNKVLGPRKIGLYTSPHLVAVRERIRINSEPISEEMFARYFFEVWRALEAARERTAEAGAGAGADADVDADGGSRTVAMPTYFRFLTLMSFHVFLREGVDAAVYEVGVGGEFDATNVFVAPAATAITTLGIDHVEVLGATRAAIAWHKAGILKAGCPAFTIPQDGEDGEDAVLPVLRQRAAERHTTLTVLPLAAPPDAGAAAASGGGGGGGGGEGGGYDTLLRGVRIVPAEAFQRKNAALAVALAATVLRRLGVDESDIGVGVADGRGSLPAAFVAGLENVVWRGRCETTVTGRQRWYLDGAHNRQSLDVACRWFQRVVAEEEEAVAKTETKTKTEANSSKQPIHVLVFNQQSNRDAVELLRVVHSTVYHGAAGQRFAYAVFCTNVTYKDKSWKVDFVNNNVDPASLKNLTLQRELAAVWAQLDPASRVATMPTIEDAIDFVRQIGSGSNEDDGSGSADRPTVRVLVTGSFHLIGGALSVLEGEDFALGNTSAAGAAC